MSEAGRGFSYTAHDGARLLLGVAVIEHISGGGFASKARAEFAASEYPEVRHE